LLGLVGFFAAWEVLPFDQRAAATFVQLRQQGVRIGTMDLKIAAIALEHQALVLSGNLRDFQRVCLTFYTWRFSPGRVAHDANYDSRTLYCNAHLAF
jgi:hypothetical protein